MADARRQLEDIERRRRHGEIDEARYHAERSALVDALLPARLDPAGWALRGFAALGVAALALVGAAAVALLLAIAGGDGDDPPAHNDVRVAYTPGAFATLETLDFREDRVTLLSIDETPDSDGRRVLVEALVEPSAQSDVARGGDFSSSFAVLAGDGSEIEASAIRVELTFELPPDVSIESVRYNPNLFFDSVIFDVRNSPPTTDDGPITTR